MKKCPCPTAAPAYCSVRYDVNARQNTSRKKFTPRAPLRPHRRTAARILFQPACGPGAAPTAICPMWQNSAYSHSGTLHNRHSQLAVWLCICVCAEPPETPPAFTRSATLRPPWRTPVRARQSNFKVHLLEWPRPQYSQTTLQRFLQGGTHGTRLFSRSQRCCAGHQLQP